MPVFHEFTGDDEDALEFVVRANMHRRHLTDPQRALIAGRLVPMFVDMGKKRMAEAGREGGVKSGASRRGEAKGMVISTDPSGEPQKPAPTSRDKAAALMNAVKLGIKTSSAIRQTISKDVANEEINSHTIAFWVHQTHVARHVQFGIGLTQADEFTEAIKTPTKDEWFPYFFQTADLPTISFKRFKALNEATTPAIYVTELFLPGRLAGAYRWRYTHYNSTTTQESAPSAISNSGQPMDFSAEGISYETTTTKAFQKSAMMTFTTDDSGATTNKIRIYRSGGVQDLTKDSRGRDLWLRVGEIFDVSTTLSAGPSAGDTSITVTSATNIAVGDWLVIEKGVANKEEYVKVTSIAGAPTLTVSGLGSTGGLIYAHSNGSAVQMAFLDNVANESISVLNEIDAERDDPPSAAKWVRRAPDGRLWLLNYSGKPTGVRVSNKPTPLRPIDYEVFPQNVDPLTRRSPTQGWDFEIGGDTTDEEIVWGDFWRGRMHILTRRNMYVVDALSQAEWGPNSVYKILDVGCIAGDTVQEIEGALYWVAPGPQVVRWSGDGPVEALSRIRVSTRLKSALAVFWNRWLARAWANDAGKYYRLYYTPSDGGAENGNAHILDYNVTQDAWEPLRHMDVLASRKVWQMATWQDSGADVNELYQCDNLGRIYMVDTGSTDDGIAIPFTAKSKRYNLGDVYLFTELFVRLTGVTDTLTITVVCGGSEYGDKTAAYTASLSGSGDVEIKQRLDRSLKGRWLEITFSGSFSNRPQIRECRVIAQMWRSGRQAL